MEPGHVDVYCVEVAAWAAAIGELERSLAAAEVARADRFHFQRDRERYVVQMGLTRRVLAGRSRCLPHEMRFVAGPTGKPSLAAVQGGDRVEFNVSHSGGLVLIALTSSTPVGVDLEVIRPMPDLQSIAATHFQAAESALLASLPESEAQVLFYQIWTAKEAVLKATGDGIASKLGEVEVARRGAEDGGRKTEDGGRRADVRGQRTEDRGQRAEGGSRNSDPRASAFAVGASAFALWATADKTADKPSSELPAPISHLLSPISHLPSPDSGAERGARSSLRLVRVPGGWPAAAEWTLVELAPAEGFVGALAVPVPGVAVSMTWLRPDSSTAAERGSG